MSATHQPSLFEDADDVVRSADISGIPGLQYVTDFIDRVQQDELLRDLDAQPWLTDLKRRVQHYGYKYDYKARRIDQSMRMGALPKWAIRVAEDLVQRGLMPERPDQLIVNEYQPGQGIAPHVDCVPCFTETIVSLSLGSACIMNFANKQTALVVPLLLNPGSLVILKGESRYNWTHGIASRKSDDFQGKSITRRRRVSLTFRKVILAVTGD
ncbi:MAG: alpha-ketoglutarate-dependent dioxygenase AlkB [Planctomycetaceae bacterium]|nr:alpha-ketoglutarate-dependent dioxygenase AlkB [Planctomycetaceae bacterium]